MDKEVVLYFNYFKERKTDCNLKQVYYPKDCIIITNPIGSADGFIIEKYFLGGLNYVTFPVCF